MPNEIEAPRWTPDADLTITWASSAQRATIMIDAIGDDALATLLDDSCCRVQSDELPSRATQYVIANDLVPEFLATAARAWARHGGDCSLAVFWGQRPLPDGESTERTPNRGVSWPPPPPPPPVPLEDPTLYLMLMTAHLQMLAVSEHIARQARQPPDGDRT